MTDGVDNLLIRGTISSLAGWVFDLLVGKAGCWLMVKTTEVSINGTGWKFLRRSKRTETTVCILSKIQTTIKASKVVVMRKVIVIHLTRKLWNQVIAAEKDLKKNNVKKHEYIYTYKSSYLNNIKASMREFQMDIVNKAQTLSLTSL